MNRCRALRGRSCKRGHHPGRYPVGIPPANVNRSGCMGYSSDARPGLQVPSDTAGDGNPASSRRRPYLARIFRLERRLGRIPQNPEAPFQRLCVSPWKKLSAAVAARWHNLLSKLLTRIALPPLRLAGTSICGLITSISSAWNSVTGTETPGRPTMATERIYSLDTSFFMDWQARYYP
jgi:hypothetical protein